MRVLAKGAALALVALTAQAQERRVTQADVDPPADILIDCAGASPEAVVTVPPALSAYARVVCTRFGHAVIPAEGWLWVVPGAGVPFRISALPLDAPPTELGHSAHFTGLATVSLDAADVARMRADGVDVPSNAGEGAVVLVLRSSMGWEGLAVFFSGSGDGYFPIVLEADGRRGQAIAASFEAVNRERR